MSHEHSHQCCSNVPVVASVQQTLDELDFQRGVWSAAMDGEMNRVLKYIRDGGDVNAGDSSGYTALHYAARNGHTKICQALLDSGAIVNIQTRSGGSTPLHRAAYQGHLEVTKLLLSKGADVNLLDSDGKTPLHKAAERERIDVCKLLLTQDSSLLQVKDKHGRLPVDCITTQNNYLLRQLLQKT